MSDVQEVVIDDEPIDQYYAEQHYIMADVGIPIRHPVTRETYTLYGPHKLDVLRRRMNQGFVVIGPNPLDTVETSPVVDPGVSGGVSQEAVDDSVIPVVDSSASGGVTTPVTTPAPAPAPDTSAQKFSLRQRSTVDTSDE